MSERGTPYRAICPRCHETFDYPGSTGHQDPPTSPLCPRCQGESCSLCGDTFPIHQRTGGRECPVATEQAAVRRVVAHGDLIGVAGTRGGCKLIFSLPTRHSLTCPACKHETAFAIITETVAGGRLVRRLQCIECHDPAEAELVDSTGTLVAR